MRHLLRPSVLVTAALSIALAVAAVVSFALADAQAQPAGSAAPTCVVHSLPSFVAQGESPNAATVADIVEVECNPTIYGTGSKLTITANQLYDRCAKDLTWWVPNPFSKVEGKGVSVALDADGNATVALVAGPGCQAGESLVAAHMEETPFETFTTSFSVLPPVITPPGLFVLPASQVEDAQSSGVATIIQAEFTNGSEKTVRIGSEELYARCRVAPHLHWIGIDRSEVTGPEVTGVPLDNDGNGFVLAIGDDSCAPGASLIEGDLEAKPFTTEVAEFTILPPQPTGEPSFTIEKVQEIAGSGDGFTKLPLKGAVGQTVDYQMTVTNTSQFAETFSEFTDAHCDPGTIAGGPGSNPVAPGGSSTYTCDHALTQSGTYTNEAMVTGTTAGGTPLRLSSNQVLVEVPEKPVVPQEFTIEKQQKIAGSSTGFTTSTLTGAVGQTVEYQIVVTNTGTVAVTLSNFTDAHCDAGTIGGGLGEASLAPGSSTTYTCRHVLTSPGNFVNEATVTGAAPGAPPATKTSNNVVVSVPEPPGPKPNNVPASSGEAPTTVTSTPQKGVESFQCVSPPALHGASGSKKEPFTVSINSRGIKQIMFYLDGREIKVLKQSQAKAGKFTLKIDPRKLSYGPHKLVIKTFMSDRACARVARRGLFVRPASASRSPSFTG